MLQKKNKITPKTKKDSKSTVKDNESLQQEVILFVVKEEQSYLEQSYAASKRQSVAHNSGKLLDKIYDIDSNLGINK